MNVRNRVFERFVSEFLAAAISQVYHHNAFRKERKRQQVGIRMMALINQDVAAIRRRRGLLNDTWLTNGGDFAVKVDDLKLRCSVVVKAPLIFRTLQRS